MEISEKKGIIAFTAHGLRNQLCVYLPNIQTEIANLSEMISQMQMHIWFKKHQKESIKMEELLSEYQQIISAVKEEIETKGLHKNHHAIA